MSKLFKRQMVFWGILEILGKLHCQVKLDNGNEVKRHIDQRRKIGENRERDVGKDDLILIAPPKVYSPKLENSEWMEPTIQQPTPSPEPLTQQEPTTQPEPSQQPEKQNCVRKSTRVIRKPNRLDLL